MALNKDNVETVTKLLVGLTQRHQEIYTLLQHLNSGTVWRSTDGSAQIDFGDKEREGLEAFVKAYLQETEVIAATLKAFLGDAAPKGP